MAVVVTCISSNIIRCVGSSIGPYGKTHLFPLLQNEVKLDFFSALLNKNKPCSQLCVTFLAVNLSQLSSDTQTVFFNPFSLQ